MTILRSKDIARMSKPEREKKLKELKLELIKSRGNSSKSGSTKIKEIKKTIAKILTINKSKNSEDSSSEIPKQKKQPRKKEELKQK